jgi:hypothetical protein
MRPNHMPHTRFPWMKTTSRRALPFRMVQPDPVHIDEHVSSPPAVAPEGVKKRCRQPHPSNLQRAGLAMTVPSPGNESRYAHE